jgi:hypothetical protein
VCSPLGRVIEAIFFPDHQVTTLFNVLHGAMLTQGEFTGVDLAVLVPPFTPKLSHLGTKFAPSLPFSDVFDLPRLIQEIEIPVVEWHQVKQPTACCGNITMAPQEMLSQFAQQVEEELLSCWAAPMSKAKGESSRIKVLRDCPPTLKWM